ncbi:MAG: hypothetical protein JXA18_12860 [Chitinispirillaceae bacterium]|nr:hypothetical protein [Chitinispirillaceae bacterium]
MSLFEIRCPLCKGILWIDPASGKVVDHKAADRQKSNFEDFIKARKQGTAWDEKMKKAKEEEAKRKAEIEIKFKVAKETTDGTPDESLQSPLNWD